jgi:hypothetical protein
MASPMNGMRKNSSALRVTELMDNSLKNLGEIVLSDKIIFDKVPILSPNGDTLIREMNF